MPGPPHVLVHELHLPSALTTQSTGHGTLLHERLRCRSLPGHAIPPCDARRMMWREQVVLPPPHERVQGVQPPGALTTQSEGHGTPAVHEAFCVSAGQALPPWSIGISTVRERRREWCTSSPHEAGQALQLPHGPVEQSEGHALLAQNSSADRPPESGHSFPPFSGCARIRLKHFLKPSPQLRPHGSQLLKLDSKQSTEAHGRVLHVRVTNI
jgi:hypothetical protein